MDVYLHDKNTNQPIANAHMFYTDSNGDPYLMLTPEISNAKGQIDFDASVSRYVSIEHPEYVPMKYEFPEIQTSQHIVKVEPLFGTQPGEKKSCCGLTFKSFTDQPVATLITFGLMAGIAWWLLKSR
jgi:hypothetical protein